MQCSTMLQQQETRVFNGENVLNFFSEDSHNTQRTHFWCVSGWIYAIQLSNKDYEVLSIFVFIHCDQYFTTHAHKKIVWF